MQNMTGHAPNMRFITVHIVNLVLLCITTTSQAILNIKVQHFAEIVNSCETYVRLLRWIYAWELSELPVDVIMIITDFFLLYLLMRFSKSKKTVAEDTEKDNSIEFYAHSQKHASIESNRAVKKRFSTKRRENQKDQTEEFITAIFKEVLDEAEFERCIGEEFTDDSNRKSNEMDVSYVE